MEVIPLDSVDGIQAHICTPVATPGLTPQIAIFDNFAEVPYLGRNDSILTLNFHDDDELMETANHYVDTNLAAEVMTDILEGRVSFSESPADSAVNANDVPAVVTVPVTSACVTVEAPVVPDVDNKIVAEDNNAEDNDITMETAPSILDGIDELKIPEIKRRRKKRETPAAAKTAAWVARRQKNNRAAALNRAKRRLGKVFAKEAFDQLRARNTALRTEVAELEATLAMLKARKATQSDSYIREITDSILTGLDPAQYSLTPPAIPI